MNDDLICFRCKHFDVIGGCEAFPDGIIPDVVLATNEHDQPLMDQDNKKVFEPSDDHFDDGDDHPLFVINLN